MEETRLHAELKALKEVLESLPKGRGTEQKKATDRVAEIELQLQLINDPELVGS